MRRNLKSYLLLIVTILFTLNTSSCVITTTRRIIVDPQNQYIPTPQELVIKNKTLEDIKEFLDEISQKYNLIEYARTWNPREIISYKASESLHYFLLTFSTDNNSPPTYFIEIIDFFSSPSELSSKIYQELVKEFNIEETEKNVWWRQRVYDATIGSNAFKNKFAEFGLMERNVVLINGEYRISDFGILSEVDISTKKLIAAPQVSLQRRSQSGFFVSSFKIIYYTDFIHGSLKLRPEIGIGSYKVTLLYGYNINVHNSGIEDLNTHTICLQFRIPFYRNNKKFY